MKLYLTHEPRPINDPRAIAVHQINIHLAREAWLTINLKQRDDGRLIYRPAFPFSRSRNLHFNLELMAECVEGMPETGTIAEVITIAEEFVKRHNEARENRFAPQA